jgi:hypothetical protein
MIMKQTRHWHFEDETDPLKGPKGNTAFLKDNYKLMGIGGIFRTPKARFSHTQIHAGATEAGFTVRIDEEGPWLKVTVIGKLSLKTPTPKKQEFYTGAGKVYTQAPDIFS